MKQTKEPFDWTGFLISCISLFLALPATFLMGMYAVMGAVGGVFMFFSAPSLEALEVFLYGAGGLLGICGLWLRALVQPFLTRPQLLATLVAGLLLVGAFVALALVMVDIRGNTHPITHNVEISLLGKGLLALAVISIAIALHNICSNLSFKHDALKRAP